MRGMISRAAMKLFLTEGFERTSIRRIAQEIEYTPGAIYSYFKDKDEILYALHNEGFDRLAVAFSTIPPSDDPFEDLRHCGEAYLRFALENRSLTGTTLLVDGGQHLQKFDRDFSLM